MYEIYISNGEGLPPSQFGVSWKIVPKKEDGLNTLLLLLLLSSSSSSSSSPTLRMSGVIPVSSVGVHGVPWDNFTCTCFTSQIH
jgi:hypothetical protein